MTATGPHNGRNAPRPAPDPDAIRRSMLRRILALKIGLFLFFVVVAGRLIYIQVFRAPHYQEIARRQYEQNVTIPALRGGIYDRNGKVLASNAIEVSFAADPKLAGERLTALADRFARTLGKSRASYLARLKEPGRRYVWLERRISPELAARIRPAEFPGLVQLEEPRRLYHNDHVGGQLIGFTDVDNRGLSGVELQCDSYLRGTNGYMVMQRDGLGRRHASVDYPRVEPINGNHVRLTIDLAMQAIAEQELKRGVDRTGAVSGLAVMLQPHTGEVLAMAHYPPLNPNSHRSALDAAMKNRSITDMFEPGSVFKVVTASAAIEHGIVTPDQKFFAENGSYHVAGRKRPITDTHEYGMITFSDAVALSSNIVMAKVSDRIGAEIFYTTARDFGFGTPTGLDLPGEVPGVLKKPTQWSATTLNTMAYGYEVGVTPIQLIAAYGAVANGGVLMKPWIVKQVTDPRGEVIAEGAPQTIRRVISAATAATMTRMFCGVVEHGTGEAARIDGMRIAGKTGTSRKFSEGQYVLGDYTASFAGFFPADTPQVACLIMLDKPKVGGYYGGQASAPIFRAIAEKVAAIPGAFTRQPTSPVPGREPVVVPDVIAMDGAIATEILESRGFDVEAGEGVVLGQSPRPGTKVEPGQRIRLTTSLPGAAAHEGFTVVPDLRGLSIRRALNRLTAVRLGAAVTGSGLVAAQSPRAGERIKSGSRVALRCAPRPVLLASGQ